MAKYLNDIIQINSDQDVWEIMGEKAAADVKNYYRALALHSNKSEANEEAKALRKKAVNEYVARIAYVHNNARNVGRTIECQIDSTVPVEDVKKLDSPVKSDPNMLNNASARKIWRKNIFEAYDEYMKPGHGIFNMNMSDREFIDNIQKSYSLIAAFGQNKKDLEDLLAKSKENNELSKEEIEKFNIIIDLQPMLSNYNSYIINRYDMIISPFYDIYGTTAFSADERHELVAGIGLDDGSLGLTRSSIDSDIKFMEIYSRIISLDEFKTSEQYNKYKDCTVFDDNGNTGTLKEIIDHMDQVMPFDFEAFSDNLYIKDPAGKLVKLGRVGSGRYEFNDTLPEDEIKKATKIDKALNNKEIQALINNINDIKSVISCKGFPLTNQMEDYKRELKGGLFRNGEVYYRDEADSVHHLVLKEGKLENQKIEEKDFENVVSENYRSGLKAIHESRGNNETISDDYIKIVSMEKAEPGFGGNRVIVNALGEMANAVNSLIDEKGANEAYNNVSECLGFLFSAYNVFSEEERKQAFIGISGLANAYLAGFNGKKHKAGYEADKVAAVQKIADFAGKVYPECAETLSEIHLELKTTSKTYTAADKAYLLGIIKKSIPTMNFNADAYSLYLALSDDENEGLSQKDRFNAWDNVKKDIVLDYMTAGLKDIKLPLDMINDCYDFIQRAQKLLNSRQDTQEILNRFRQLFHPENGYANGLPAAFLNVMDEKYSNVLSKKFKINVETLNLSADEKKFDNLFGKNTAEKFISHYKNEAQARAELLKLVGLTADEAPVYSPFKDTLADTMKEICFEANGRAVKEIFNKMKREYLNYNSKRYEAHEKAEIEAKGQLKTEKDALTSIYGENGVVSELIDLLDSGDRTFRGSSALYKEIRADLLGLYERKGTDAAYELRYGKASLLAIAEKADRYIASHSAREMKYGRDSYEGKRIDNMRKLSATIKTFIDKLKLKTYYKESKLSGDNRRNYREEITKLFEKNKFSMSLYEERLALAKFKDNLNEVANNENIDGVIVRNRNKFGYVFDILQVGLGGRKVKLPNAQKLFRKIKNNIQTLQDGEVIHPEDKTNLPEIDNAVAAYAGRKMNIDEHHEVNNEMGLNPVK